MHGLRGTGFAGSELRSVDKGAAADGRVLIFYHVTAKGQYKSAIRQQMGSILLSGLYSRADAVYACVLGEAAEAIDAASQLLQAHGAKISILQPSQDAQQMERLTLTAMAGVVQPGDRVLYIHSKGISYEEDS